MIVKKIAKIALLSNMDGFVFCAFVPSWLRVLLLFG